MGGSVSNRNSRAQTHSHGSGLRPESRTAGIHLILWNNDTWNEVADSCGCHMSDLTITDVVVVDVVGLTLPPSHPLVLLQSPAQTQNVIQTLSIMAECDLLSWPPRF